MQGLIIIVLQQIGLATSTDGIHWRKVSNKPFLANGDPGAWNYCESGHPHIFKDKDGQTYLFYQGNEDFGRTWFLSQRKIIWEGWFPSTEITIFLPNLCNYMVGCF